MHRETKLKEFIERQAKNLERPGAIEGERLPLLCIAELKTVEVLFETWCE
jgi:hypothetical protein